VSALFVEFIKIDI